MPRPRRTAAYNLRLRLGVLGDYVVSDFLVSRLGHNFFRDELVLVRIGTTLDDLAGIAVTDAGQHLQLGRSRTVDVDRVHFRRSRRAPRIGGRRLWRRRDRRRHRR